MLMYFIDKEMLAAVSGAACSFIKNRLYTPKFCLGISSIYLDGSYTQYDNIFIPVDMSGITVTSIC